MASFRRQRAEGFLADQVNYYFFTFALASVLSPCFDPGTMKNVRLHPDTHQAVKIKAAQLGTKLEDTASGAIDLCIELVDKGKVPASKLAKASEKSK